MLAIIRCRIFCLQDCYPKIYSLRYTELQFCPLFVLYECETCSLILREECRRKVFENLVLRRVFGPKRDEVTREWRKLHNEELSDLYSSSNIIGLIK